MKLDSAIIGKIKGIAARYGVTSVRVFGSYTKGTAEPDSDLDLLITLEPGRDLLDLIGFKQEIEEALGISVDVVTEKSLSPYFRDEVLEEAVAI